MRVGTLTFALKPDAIVQPKCDTLLKNRVKGCCQTKSKEIIRTDLHV